MATRYKLIHSGKKLSDLSATTSAELAGVISDETGSGLLVFSNAPTFDTTIGFKGSISGTTTLKAAPVASTYTVTELERQIRLQINVLQNALILRHQVQLLQ